ncbi:MAG: glucose-1-phosphate thymidylyltransferase [Chloroflexia bacterium]
MAQVSKALVLCGGKGTRLRPLTHTMAKQLVPVANRPVLHYVMQHLADVGITQVGIIISPETGHQIRESLAANPWGFTFHFIVQDEPRGLAHAVVVARPFLGDDPFVMYLGDNLLGAGIQELVGNFVAASADAAILLKEVPNPQAFGVAEVDSAGRVVGLIEKPQVPPSNLALVGAYTFSPAIHRAIGAIQPSWRGELEITDAIRQVLEWGGTVQSSVLESWWLDTGKKDDLLEANRVVLDEYARHKIDGEVSEDTRLFGRVTIDRGARLQNCVIRGPVVIGENTQVENSFIGPFTSIGQGCRIIDSSIEHAVLLDGAIVSGIARLEDSIIGQQAIVRKADGRHSVLRLALGDDSEVIL